VSPRSVQRRASLHETAVQKVARGNHVAPRAPRKSTHRGHRASSPTVRTQHPALRMAYALGIPAENVQITGEAPRWGCIIWNHPAPWPGVQDVHSVNEPNPKEGMK